MKERPILFSAPMVRAILAGTKTQTRRIVKDNAWVMDDFPPYIDRFRCPYGQPGDRLWVRETWCREFEGGYLYRADDISGSAPDFVDGNGDPTERSGWKPSIHMPRAASRITLEITGVRVERLNDISEDDAKAEGVTSQQIPKPWGHETGWCADWSRVGQPSKYGHDGKSLAASDICHASARHAYWNLWESINGPDSWAANPWVWVVEFRRLP